LFCGFDPREAIGFSAFVRSVIEHTKSQVQFIPLTGEQKDGTNAFTYQRFRVPEICGFQGYAIFADACDMLALGDVRQLWDMRDQGKAVQVVKHEYQTRHPRKYVGTELEAPNEDYPRKNWSSLILWNCGHMAHSQNRHLLRSFDGQILHRFAWLDDELIGEIPKEWNHLVGEYDRNPRAKLAHFTLGIPGFDAYSECEYADEWRAAVSSANRGMQYDMKRHSSR
jgi:hypothetical protein